MILNTDFRSVDIDLLGACDIMIVDPAYSEHVHENAVSTRTGGVGPRDRDLGFEHLSPEDREYLALIASCMKRWSVVFSDVESTHLWRADMAANGVEYVREVPATYNSGADYVEGLPPYWVRWSQPQVTGDRPCTGAEAVLHFHAMTPAGPRGGKPRPIAKRWNGHGGWTHYNALALRGEDKHPTEKPLDLMLTLVASFSDEGETVLDPCAGRGTTGLACLLLGRDYVLIERKAQWAAAAEKRLKLEGFHNSKDWARAANWAARIKGEVGRTWAGKAEPKREAIDRPAWERAQRLLACAVRVAKHCNLK